MSHLCPAFLLDGEILLDAGTVGPALTAHEEKRIRHSLLTHAHFDHIKAIPLMLDNLVTRETGTSVTVVSGKDVIRELRRSVFNDRIWPDFTQIPTPQSPALAFRAIDCSRPTTVNGCKVSMERVHHAVPSYGYIVEDAQGTPLAYTGDTGPTDQHASPGFIAASSSRRCRRSSRTALGG